MEISFMTAVRGLFIITSFVGAADYILDNRFGIGEQFERGLCCAGKLIIAMTGFMALSSVLGAALSPILSPIFTAIGADPSAIAGMLLACDSGGVAMAEKLAADPQAGIFNGYFVGSMLGGAVMCLISMVMICTDARVRRPAIYGLLIGLASVPFGCAVGGVMAGIPFRVWALNLVPASVFSAFLIIALLFFGDYVVKPFQIFGKFLLSISLTGLCLTTVSEILGISLIDGLQPFSEIALIIGDIALMLSVVFPAVAVISRVLDKPLSSLGLFLGIDKRDVSGLMICAVNVFPALDSLNSMSKRGAMINTAFMVGAGCIIGDHFAFTMQTAPELTLPVTVAKAVSGLLAVSAAAVFGSRLMKE